jgi:UDP-3-O-[3-hydroxymyristoyl] glucosamine N-acyltransferase
MKQTTYTLGDIAQRVGATLVGNASHIIEGLASLQNAQSTQLAFLSNPRYKSQLTSTQAGAVLLHQDNHEAYQGNALIVKDPYAAFAQLTHWFDQTPKALQSGIHATAVIASSAKIDPTASIGAFVVIEDDVVVGKNTVIESHSYLACDVLVGNDCWLDKHVIIQHGCRLADHVRVHANTVIGADGFGFAPYAGKWHRIAQLGRVMIGHHVRIGANCTIDRGALDDTVIGDGVIIDNLVQIAHNVSIGQHTAIAAQVGIAGSTHIGQHCIIGGASGIAGHLKIADHVHLTGMSMVTKSINKAGTYSSGTSISENTQWKKMIVGLRQLAENPVSKVLKQIEDLQVRLERVESTSIVTTHSLPEQHD